MTEFETVACLACGSDDAIPTVSAAHDPWLAALGKSTTVSTWAICRGCGFVYQNPRLTAADEARLYDGSVYYEQTPLTEGYVQRRLDKALRVWRWLDGHLPALLEHPRMFEIGCGLGGALKVFSDDGWNASGIEPDRAIAQAGRERWGVKIYTGVFGDGIFPGLDADLVYTNHAYEHFRDPLAITRAARAVLRPGGYLFIAVPTFRRAHGVFAWSWMNAAHMSLFTHVSLGHLVGRVGFAPVAWRYQSADGELWFLARRTETVVEITATDRWRGVRRALVLGPLRHLLSSPRGWPTVLQGYAEYLLGAGCGDALLAWLRRWRPR